MLNLMSVGRSDLVRPRRRRVSANSNEQSRVLTSLLDDAY